MVNLLLSLNNFDENWCYSILKNIIKDNHNVLIIPFSYDDNWLKDKNDWNRAFSSEYGTHYKDIVSPFLSYGINENNIKWINQFVDSIDLMKLKIRNSDILFFTGGYPDKMMAKFQKYDLVHELENFNGIMIGTSAGAMVQIREYHITKDSDYERYSYYIGLNIIKDFDIEVHFENTELQNLDVIWTSNYTRAKATAKYIAYKNNLQYNIDKRLSERKLGNMDDLAKFMNNKETRDPSREQLAFPEFKTRDGESANDTNKRMNDFFNEILEKYKGKRIAVISHGGTIKFYLLSFCKVNERLNLEYKENELAINSPCLLKMTFRKNELVNLEQMKL